jgi:preprotein translocase subunit SecD
VSLKEEEMLLTKKIAGYSMMMSMFFAVVASCAEQSAPPLSVHLVARPMEGGKLFLSWEGDASISVSLEAIATAEDIVSMQLIRPSEGVAISLQLKDYAAQRLQEVTAQSVDRKLAILLQEKVLMTPTIREPITNGRLVLSAPTEGETHSIYESLNGVYH